MEAYLVCTDLEENAGETYEPAANEKKTKTLKLKLLGNGTYKVGKAV